jgi:hypothetical protein
MCPSACDGGDVAGAIGSGSRGELAEIVDGADHGPFGGGFVEAAQQELSEAACLLDLAEHGLDAFRRAGIDDLRGYDRDYVGRSVLRILVDCFEPADLSKPLRLSRRYDLACSLEVGEHLPPASSDHLVSSLVTAAPVALFSAAIPRQGGFGHVNEQWQDWWAAKLWGDPDVAPWFQQNTIIYGDETNEEVARAAAMHRRPRSLNCAHPAV